MLSHTYAQYVYKSTAIYSIHLNHTKQTISYQLSRFQPSEQPSGQSYRDFITTKKKLNMMWPPRDDVSHVQGFILTLQETIQQNGDPDETDHLRAEACVDDFIAAMKWVKYLHGRAQNLSEQARDQGWKQFLHNIEGVMRHVARWAYEKYPEGLLYAKMMPRKRGGTVWDPSGGTDRALFGPFEDDNTTGLQQDWTWALKAAMDLELVTKLLFKHCEEVTGMMRADFEATDMAAALEGISL